MIQKSGAKIQYFFVTLFKKETFYLSIIMLKWHWTI